MAINAPIVTSPGTLAPAQNRVLRNTYALLALSLVPTVIGAWLGVQLKFSFMAGSPFIGFILFLGIAFGFFKQLQIARGELDGKIATGRQWQINDLCRGGMHHREDAFSIIKNPQEALKRGAKILTAPRKCRKPFCE